MGSLWRCKCVVWERCLPTGVKLRNIFVIINLFFSKSSEKDLHTANLHIAENHLTDGVQVFGK